MPKRRTKPVQPVHLEPLTTPIILYSPHVAKYVGGKNAAILLAQLRYWTVRATLDDGWIYKSQYELMEETGLTTKEQISARKALQQRHLIEWQYHARTHQLYLRINVDVYNELISKVNQEGQCRKGTNLVPKGNEVDAKRAGHCISEITPERNAAGSLSLPKNQDPADKPSAAPQPAEDAQTLNHQAESDALKQRLDARSQCMRGCGRPTCEYRSPQCCVCGGCGGCRVSAAIAQIGWTADNGMVHEREADYSVA